MDAGSVVRRRTVRSSGTVRVCGRDQERRAQAAGGGVARARRDRAPQPAAGADLDVMIDVLRAIGRERRVDAAPNELHDRRRAAPSRPEAPYELVSRMRASINVLGPLLARCGEARVAMPGGDNIGSRKLDMHFRGLQAMGAELEVVHGFIEARCRTCCTARAIVLDFPSVGATENLLHRGRARQGRDGDRERGARARDHATSPRSSTAWARTIVGAGTTTIEIEGVDELTRSTTRSWATASRRGRCSWRAASRAARSSSRASRLEHLEMVVDEARRDGHARLADSRRPLGPLRRAAHARRRGDAAVPRLRHRLHADGGRAARGRRGHGDRHRERVRQPVRVRRRARTAWAPTSAPRAATRSCGASPGCRARPVRASTCGPAPRSSLAGLAADGETVVLDGTTSTAGYPDLAGQLRALGADVQRV